MAITAANNSYGRPFPDGRSLLDLLTEDGVVGLAESGRDDVATNPAYMDGFGLRSAADSPPDKNRPASTEDTPCP